MLQNFQRMMIVQLIKVVQEIFILLLYQNKKEIIKEDLIWQILEQSQELKALIRAEEENSKEMETLFIIQVWITQFKQVEMKEKTNLINLKKD